MIPIPVRLKALVPGYRAKWRHRYTAMIDHAREHAPRLTFGADDTVPWLEERNGGPRLHGFWTEPANAEVYDLLAGDLPEALPKEHFRLFKDYVNRYLYPHMRPDLKPKGYAVEQLFGFHGQHKDAIADLDDAGARTRLEQAFTPKPGDVVIDGGPFLGFGEIRLAPDIGGGHLYAIEADRDCHALLERNLRHNGIENATALHCALWNEATQLELESGYAQANTLVSEVHKGETTQKVDTITIDGVVERFGLHRVDMLSLTLNGAEVEALEGAQRTLSDLRPRIRLAGWYKRGDSFIWQLTKVQLEAHGYDVFPGPRGNLMALPA